MKEDNLMKYKLILTDNFGKVNLYLKEALTADLRNSIEALRAVEKVNTFEDYPLFLEVYKTTNSSLENLALQLYKLLTTNI